MYQIRRTVFQRVSGLIAAGTTNQAFTIDTLGGFRSVCFTVGMGAIVSTAVTSLKLGQGNLADGSDAVDITGATVTIPDDGDNKIYLLELMRLVPANAKRYLTITVIRTIANSTIEFILATLRDDRFTDGVLQDASVGAKTEKISS